MFTQNKTALLHAGGCIASTLSLLCGLITPTVEAAGKSVSVEQALPTKPYKASMEVFSSILPGVRAEDLIFAGGDGAIGITSITVTNKDNRQKSITVSEPAAGGLRACGTPVWTAPSSFVVMVAPLATVQLTFPSPLVFSAVNGHTCFGLQVNELANSVQVLLTGFSN